MMVAKPVLDRDRYGPWAVIAGGSDGTGAAFARDVAASGINLLLVARRQGPLDTLAALCASDCPRKKSPTGLGRLRFLEPVARLLLVLLAEPGRRSAPCT